MRHSQYLISIFCSWTFSFDQKWGLSKKNSSICNTGGGGDNHLPWESGEAGETNHLKKKIVKAPPGPLKPALKRFFSQRPPPVCKGSFCVAKIKKFQIGFLRILSMNMTNSSAYSEKNTMNFPKYSVYCGMLDFNDVSLFLTNYAGELQYLY